MKEIQHNKFSLILIEKPFSSKSHDLIAKCFIHLDTFDFLEEAQLAQKENKQKTLIISSW